MYDLDGGRTEFENALAVTSGEVHQYGDGSWAGKRL
jgi:hypothetical protein